MAGRKRVLFFPLNSPGHINSSLGLADRLKRDHNCETIFLLLGSMISDSIRQRDHQLIILDEVAPYEDEEISSEGEATDYDRAIEKNTKRKKTKFPGVFKWPQVLARHSDLLRLEPVEAFVQSCRVLERFMVDELIENHANYSRIIGELAPDLIVIDAYYVPPCIVRPPKDGSKQIPWVRLYSANPLMLIKSALPGGIKPVPMMGFKLYNPLERQRMRANQPDKWNAMLAEWRLANERMVAAMGETSGPLTEFMVEHGCEPLNPGEQAHNSPYLNVYMFPKALDYDQDEDLFCGYPERWLRCQWMLRDSPTAGKSLHLDECQWEERLLKARAEGRIIIFFSLGSLASGDWRLVRHYVDFFRQDSNEQHLYVVSKGVNGRHVQLHERNMLGGDYVPQTIVLRHAQLAIIHGGNNSVTECMYYAVPMLVLPVFADQLDNAQRIEDLNYGRRLDVFKCDREQLLRSTEEVLANNHLRECITLASKEMRARDEPGQVAALLAKLAQDGHLPEKYINLS